MTSILMLPKCAAGKCAWTGCECGAVSRVFRMRVAYGRVADVRFCGGHARLAIPGNKSQSGHPVPEAA